MDTIEITWQQVQEMKEEYTLIDVRDAMSFSYGNLPGSILVSATELEEHASDYKDQTLVLYCKKGEASLEAAQHLREEGITAYSLKGGYIGWLMTKMEADAKQEEAAREESEKSVVSGEVTELGADGEGSLEEACIRKKKQRTFAEEVEQSIRKTFKKSIWSRFTKAIRTYELVQEGDKIAVCISGGKDSMLMAKLFQELKRHGKVNFEVVYLVMDPGYSPENRKIIENNAKRLDLPITIFESDIFESVFYVEKSPCYLCARMRRGHLYHEAQCLGCNKIALGHHYDDVIETILMGMLYGAQVQTMMPKLHSTNFEGMELIRPMYLIREDDIKRWRDHNGLYFLQCACKFTDTCSSCQDNGQTNSARLEVKNLIREMKKTNPYVESNIFNSVDNVNLSTVISYKKDGVKHPFLETYEKKERKVFGEDVE